MNTKLNFSNINKKFQSLFLDIDLRLLFEGLLTPPWIWPFGYGFLILILTYIQEKSLSISDQDSYFSSEGNILWVYLLFIIFYIFAFVSKKLTQNYTIY
jgi:hypothetical protein